MHYAHRPPLPSIRQSRPIQPRPYNQPLYPDSFERRLSYLRRECHVDCELVDPPADPDSHLRSKPINTLRISSNEGGQSSEENGQQQEKLHEQPPTTAANFLASTDDELFGEIGWLQARYVAVRTGNAYLADHLGGEGIEGAQAPGLHQADDAVSGYPIILCLRWNLMK
jgi:hypothetical protein